MYKCIKDNEENMDDDMLNNVGVRFKEFGGKKFYVYICWSDNLIFNIQLSRESSIKPVLKNVVCKHLSNIDFFSTSGSKKKKKSVKW